MQARKEQFQGVQTSWEKAELKKRIMRQQLMAASPWVKPKAQLLQIGSVSERQDALRRGCMVFRDGDEVIELPLITPPKAKIDEVRTLQGIYKIPGKGFVVARALPKAGSDPGPLKLFMLEKFKTTRMEQVGNERPKSIPVEYWIETDITGFKGFDSFFYRVDDLGHMAIGDLSYRGHGLSLKAVSKTEREQRARQGGRHSFVGLAAFDWLFKRLGYSAESTDKTSPRVYLQFGFAPEGEEEFLMYSKAAKHQPFDDMERYHRIEAVDPKTGKARMFTFAIEGRREMRPERELARQRTE